MNKETLLDKFLVKFFSIPAIKNYWTRHYKALEFTDIPWKKLSKRIQKAIIYGTGNKKVKLTLKNTSKCFKKS